MILQCPESEPEERIRSFKSPTANITMNTTDHEGPFGSSGFKTGARQNRMFVSKTPVLQNSDADLDLRTTDSGGARFFATRVL